MMKPRLIYNPTAAKGDAGKKLPMIQDLLGRQGFEYDLYLTEYPGNAELLGLQAAEEDCDLVVVGGGDGTVNETINGLMKANKNGRTCPTLGVLPVGRGNDFAFGVGIPEDIHEACEVLIQGQSRRIDIGRVTGGDYPQGRYFGNGVGLGFDTVVGFEAAKIKWLHGKASYLVAVIRTIFQYKHAPLYEIVMDGETIRQPSLMVSVMNGRRMGGSFMMAPEGNPGDGVLDLCLAGSVSQMRILPLALTFISGTQANDPAVTMAHARQVSVRAIEGSIPAHADGETLCVAGKSLSFELFPDALSILSINCGIQQ